MASAQFLPLEEERGPLLDEAEVPLAALPQRLRPRHRWLATAAAVAAAAAASAAAAAALAAAVELALWPEVSPGRLRRRGGELLARELEVKASLLPGFQGQCGKVEDAVEYVVEGGWYMSLDHIPTVEMCCAMCQGVPQCQVFTWVKDAGLDGCPSQCWLKGGLPTATNSKPGVVSGVPPPRPAFPAALPPPPAAMPPAASMFCFSLIVARSYEQELIELQHKEKTSIFGCDAWDVYSNVSLTVCAGVTTTVVPTDLTVTFGGDSYTALNSWIFIAVWKRVIDDQRHKQHAWIVKVDADAVFFPDRLRPIVAAHAGVGFINNCKYGLHGPIEVLAAQALDVLEADYKSSFDGKAPKDCVQKLEFGLWGEDFFLSRCLWEVHGVTRETEPSLMCEAHCDCPDWYWCDGAAVTYHPFKRADMYKQCMANSIAAAGLPA